MSDPDTTADETDAAIDTDLNKVGAAGQSADPFAGRPVSGMPVGGPHTLGKEAHERRRREDGEDDAE